MKATLRLQPETELKLSFQGLFVLRLPPSRRWFLSSARMSLETCCVAFQKEFMLITEMGSRLFHVYIFYVLKSVYGSRLRALSLFQTDTCKCILTETLMCVNVRV